MSEAIGQYVVKRRLGHGATSEVFLAVDSNGKEVAVKRLHPHLTTSRSVQRLLDERLAISRLQHPGIVQVFEVHGEPNNAFLAMEYVEGVTLRDFLQKVSLVYPEVAVILGVEILEAVEHAHRHGVIHRDLKPDNIMVTASGRVKITDFGLAKSLDRERLTQTGTIVGSPVYMSPEQALSRPIDERSDLFSLGVMLYELSTGKLPFEGENPHATIRQIVDVDPERPDSINSKIDRRLCQIILQALEKNPDHRFEGVWEFAYHLKQYLHSLGLLSDRFRFSYFVQDSKSYLFELSTQMCAALIEDGREAFQEQNTFLFLTSIDHLLAVAPEHQGAKELLRKFHKKESRPIFKMLRWGGGFALLAFFLGALWYQWNLWRNPEKMNIPVKIPSKQVAVVNDVPAIPQERVVQEIPPTPQEVAKEEAPPPEPVPAAVPRKLVSAKAKPKKQTPREEPKEVASVTPVKKEGYLKLNLDDDVEVTLNEKPVEWKKDFPLALTPGEYSLTLKKPGFAQINQHIVIAEGETAVINAKTQK